MITNLPNLITALGEYVTRSGEIVVIEEVVLAYYGYGCRGHYRDGTVEHWHWSGRLFESRESANDIIARWHSG